MTTEGVSTMRRLFLGLTAVVAVVFVASAASAPTATVAVNIKRSAFSPASVTINANDVVTWKNTDTIDHQVVANGGSFASPILGAGKTYSHTFKSGGTFRYHDGLHPTIKGTVVVKGPPPQVTLVTSAAVVKYGTPVTLTGTVSNKKAGETVTLVQLPAGQTTKQVLATLQTTTNGVFSFSVTPQLNTTYQAQWKNLSESSVIVQVAPMIKLPFVSRSGYFHFYVTAGRSFAGKIAFLQRFTLAHQWVNIRQLPLGSKSGRIMSLKFVRASVPRGRWSVRIFFPATEAGDGYMDSASGTQPIVKH
jgi:plastocyanin